MIQAIILADIHLWDTPPVARSEEDWFAAMTRPFTQIRALQEQYKCPLLCAGDVFHKPNPSPALINWAIAVIPRPMITIPGQHDLPYHNYENIRKSAYWTLVEAGTIINLKPKKPYEEIPHFRIWGFPYGSEIKPPSKGHSLVLEIALIHKYLWKRGYSHTAAPKTNNVKVLINQLRGYHLAIFGDNHLAFDYKGKATYLYNCGSLMRRHSDQLNHRPSVGLLSEEGSITRHYLDCSEDQLISTENSSQQEDNSAVAKFVRELSNAAGSTPDYFEAITAYLKKHQVPEPVKKLLFEALS